MRSDLAEGGWCCGPLFAPIVKRRPPARPRGMSGTYTWRKYRAATPLWSSMAECEGRWRESEQLTRDTGIQHSVDHIVPISHPLVCGLHCPSNLRIIPLAENIHKSNNHWPDMWAPQGELF
jgi:hypothetical protein